MVNKKLLIINSDIIGLAFEKDPYLFTSSQTGHRKVVFTFISATWEMVQGNFIPHNDNFTDCYICLRCTVR